MKNHIGMLMILQVGVLSCFINQVYCDSITLLRSSIPIGNCRIQSIHAGNVNYLDAGGQTRQRALEDIAALGFDQLPMLDEAEKLLAAGELVKARNLLLVAAVNTQSNLQRLWVHARLAKVHDALKQYVEAVGHVAAVFELSNDTYWKRLEPVSDIGQTDQTTYASAKETMNRLRAAQRAVNSAELRLVLMRLINNVRPIHDALEKSYHGPPIIDNSTISGIPIEQIKNRGQSPTLAPITPDETIKSDSPDSPGVIDGLLRSGRVAQALEICQRVAKQPDQRDLARLLYQHGLALAGIGRDRDAAVMFTKAAILFPDSIFAPAGLIQTAEIYQRTYRRPDIAQRLLRRALTEAATLGQDDLVADARRLLKVISESSQELLMPGAVVNPGVSDD